MQCNVKTPLHLLLNGFCNASRNRVVDVLQGIEFPETKKGWLRDRMVIHGFKVSVSLGFNLVCVAAIAHAHSCTALRSTRGVCFDAALL
jgi:hypothetical protein